MGADVGCEGVGGASDDEPCGLRKTAECAAAVLYQGDERR